MKKFLKILLYMLLGAWTLFFIVGIAGNCKHYKIAEWIVILLIGACPFLIIAGVKLGKKKDRKQKAEFIQQYPPATPTAAKQTESSAAVSNSRGDNGLNSLVKIEVTSPFDGIPEEISDESLREIMQADILKVMQEEQNSPNPKFHRTKREEELEFQFMQKHEHSLQPYIDAFQDEYRLGSKAESLGHYNKAIEKYNEAIARFDEAQAYAYKFGKGGQIYFDDMWNHMHNSQSTDFSWKEWPQERIREILIERDYLIPELKRIISEAPGILQKDIYQYFKPEYKSKVQYLLRALSENGVIERTKKGNSYALCIK